MKVINCNWCAQYSHQRIGTETGGHGNKRTSIDHLNYSIIKIGQNTEKSPEETSCHSNSSEKPSVNTGGKNSQKSKIIMTIE